MAITIYCGADQVPARPTRFPELGYVTYGGIWRFVDASTGNTVGAIYKTKAEMMGDLTRYARECWGL